MSAIDGKFLEWAIKESCAERTGKERRSDDNFVLKKKRVLKKALKKCFK